MDFNWACYALVALGLQWCTASSYVTLRMVTSSCLVPTLHKVPLFGGLNHNRCSSRRFWLCCAQAFLLIKGCLRTAENSKTFWLLIAAISVSYLLENGVQLLLGADLRLFKKLDYKELFRYSDVLCF